VFSPLIVAMGYVGYHAKVIIEEQSKDYLKARINGFDQVTQERYSAISTVINIILDQLKIKLKSDLIKSAANEHYYKTGYLVLFQSNGLCLYHPKPELLPESQEQSSKPQTIDSPLIIYCFAPTSKTLKHNLLQPFSLTTPGTFINSSSFLERPCFRGAPCMRL
jgi:hypothetical protein